MRRLNDHDGKGKVAILVENDYQDQEVWVPLFRLREEGYRTVVIGTGAPQYKSKYGVPIKADIAAAEAKSADFKGVVVPGGWAPDRLRQDPAVLKLVQGVCSRPARWSRRSVTPAGCWPRRASCEGAQADRLPGDPRRHDPRRRRVRRPGGGAGRQPDHLPHAGRSPGLLPRDRPGAQRGLMSGERINGSGLRADRLRIGTSSWSAPSWQGVFYPAGMQPAGLHHPLRPRVRHGRGRRDLLPHPVGPHGRRLARAHPGGVPFAAKVPQVITHEKFLEDCDEETGAFIKVMERLEDRLGPLLLQFRYFRKAEFPDPGPFIDRLERYLPKLPAGRRFVVEVRNKHFVVPRLLDLLHRHGVALALIDHPWFYRIDELMRRPGILTADFVYIRWLGDRHGIERKTKTWDKLIVDRASAMGSWVGAIRTMNERAGGVYGYFNNHYAGYAVGSIRLFRETWSDADVTGG